MRLKDWQFFLGIGVITFFVILPASHDAFFGFADRYPYIGGFMKFFLFASMGDIISRRIKRGDYQVTGLLYKALVWGIIGIMVVIVFQVFPAGVLAMQGMGMLPLEGNTFAHALFSSVLMNLFFAPTMMLFHRISDAFIEYRLLSSGKTLGGALKTIDYPAFIQMLFKTVPLFWMPAHTITFLLPSTYQPFFASLLGVMLGLFLNLFKRHT